MEKIELLSPAGNKESLYMAVHAGADAVYISGKNFGARKFADNFDDNEIVDAINYCHLYGVKVYVTMNTLIFENEIKSFIEYAKFLYINNVDAIIVQDIGMISYLLKYIPDLEIHTSTQTHNYNIETTKMFKKMGVKRAVLARELTLDEIKEHSKLMDTEVFVHGALCMSYSGCCYMSLLRGSRSGNRGECAGPCRLKYTSKEGNNYLLSTRDLCNVYDLDKIIESGTKSLKIEGRMKSKEYVYLVTKLYRQTIDNYYKTGKIEVNKKTYDDINKVFNRSYTRGHKFEEKDIMNQQRPNNQGVPLGKVIKFNKKNIYIKLSSELNIGDGIKFEELDLGTIVTSMVIDNKKVTTASKNDIVAIKNEVNLNRITNVVKTKDKKLIDELKQIEEKKIKIDCDIEVNENSIKILYTDNINSVETINYEVEKPIKSPISKEEIITRMSKLGNTPFEINNINIKMNSEVFINIKTLNEIRRTLVDELKAKRVGEKRILNTKEVDFDIKIENNNEIELNVSIENENQYNSLKKFKVSNIYTSNIELYEKHKELYYIMPRIINKKYDIKNVVINDYNYIPEGNVIANYYMNITNTLSALFALNKGIQKICISPDSTYNNTKDMLDAIPNLPLEYQIYGPKEVMITKNKFGNVKFFKNTNYEYKVLDNKDYISIYSTKENNISKINEYKRINVHCFRVDFTDETEEMVNKIMCEIEKEL